jgi:SAM-dependent methyltransferase
MSSAHFDTAKADAFSAYAQSILDGGMLSLMISIGHQTGLFDVMSALPPSTSARIAEAAKLNERYVREWLGAMVAGRIVEYDPAEHTYFLPPEHAAALTRAAGRKNVCLYTRYVALLGNVEQQIIECFRNGGGVPYLQYPRFQQLQSDDSTAIFDLTLVQSTLPSVPRLMEQLQSGIDVADIGCGCGHAVNLMARAFPQSRFAGYDVSSQALESATREAGEMKLSNVRFEVKDALDLGGAERFGLITSFDAIHDQAHPARVLRAIHSALHPGGVFLMQEMAASSDVGGNLGLDYGVFMYAASCMHCVPVSLALNGEGLGAAWGREQAREKLMDAGFSRVDIIQTPGEPRHDNFVAWK